MSGEKSRFYYGFQAAFGAAVAMAIVGFLGWIGVQVVQISTDLAVIKEQNTRSINYSADRLTELEKRLVHLEDGAPMPTPTIDEYRERREEAQQTIQQWK